VYRAPIGGSADHFSAKQKEDSPGARTQSHEPQLRPTDRTARPRNLIYPSWCFWGSLKRFDREELISLEFLLKIALVLDCLVDFDKVLMATREIPVGRSLDSTLAKPAEPRRATSKNAQIT
jgi:hypothetical protein